MCLALVVRFFMDLLVMSEKSDDFLLHLYHLRNVFVKMKRKLTHHYKIYQNGTTYVRQYFRLCLRKKDLTRKKWKNSKEIERKVVIKQGKSSEKNIENSPLCSFQSYRYVTLDNSECIFYLNYSKTIDSTFTPFGTL